ncbi:DEKNAAC101453 [Brettanomyces naardenensis]|uniref:DEKNAAC101453 n=1 Tax=Brettanomyces naardenensis TaxID=13370 RepID=A0A448YI18_BRENA|nr:DEKNAAC101453 [Brettanomyces naardenensis]
MSDSPTPQLRRHVTPPAHLSEFYKFVDGPGPSQAQASATKSAPTVTTTAITTTPPNTATSDGPTAASEASDPLQSTAPVTTTTSTLSHPSSPIAPSLTSSRLLHYTLSHTDSLQSSAAPSALDLETVITARDVKETIACYQNLINTSEKYREALTQLSLAASEFGGALETCARLKGSGRASDGLMGCSGLQHLIASQQQLLVRNLEVDFEQPVSKVIDEFGQQHVETDDEFRKLINGKVKQLKKNEKNNIKLSRLKYRNIVAYRSNLQQLTLQLDQIDRLKHDYYVSSFEQVQSASRSILDRARDIVSLETTIYDSVAKKGESGGGLDDLLDEEMAIPHEDTTEIYYNHEGDAEDTLKDDTERTDGGNEEVPVEESSPYSEGSVFDSDRKFMEQAISELKGDDKDTKAKKDDNLSLSADDTYYTPVVGTERGDELTGDLLGQAK